MVRNVRKTGALGDAFCGHAGRFGIGEIDLEDVAPFRRDIARTPFFIGALEVSIRDFDPACLLCRDQRHHHELAIFRGAEKNFALLEEFRQHLRGRRCNLAGLGAVEQDVLDRALLVLVTAGRFDQGLRGAQSRRDGAGELAAQKAATLFRDEPGFGKACIADDLLEPGAVELPVQSLEGGIGCDLLGNLGVGEGET